MNGKTYTRYHMHTDYSLQDSATNISDYIELAKADGCTALGISDHGVQRGWFEHYQKCSEAGLKFLDGVEIYLTEQLEPKVRDNYHTVLIAKNMDGFRELNKLIEISTNDEHKYYKNRISFDEFLSLSDNIIKISACVASPLSKLPLDHPRYMELVMKYDYLEIQHHNVEIQKDYNRRLWELAKKTGKPLIAGTDTHSATAYKAECRDVILDGKGQSYPDEDAFDLTWKTYDELCEAYRIQDALPEEVWLQAIENTNVMADSVEPLVIDTSVKYPILYGSHEEDERIFEKTTWRMLEENINSGIIPAHEADAFRRDVAEEISVFKKLHMGAFMLSMSELLRWCHDNGIQTGPGRGSVGGSRVAYILDIIDLDPEELDTVFSRFCNPDRVEVGDIDVDVITSDRPKIFQHILERFGVSQTARVGSYGTLADLAIIDLVGRVLAKRWKKTHVNPDDPDNEVILSMNPWSLEKVSQIKEEYDQNPSEAREKYHELFYYYDGLQGVKISQSVHPAGMVICPVDMDAEFGVMHKDGERCLVISMDEVHDIGAVKYDFLGLKTLEVVRDAFQLAGIQKPKYYQMDWHDEKVWNDISKNPISLFQFESGFAATAVKKYRPKSLTDLSLVTACIRPSGESYRDNVFNHIPNHNPTREMDELFADTLGYCVYQEQIIKALQVLCGFSGGEADTVRRDIAKKKADKVAEDVIKIRDGYCARSSLPREEAEQEVEAFLRVIDDASGYSFGYNHSIEYCLLTYLCAWLRYYHPTEYITAYLNNAKLDEDIETGQTLARLYKVRIESPRFGESKDEWFCDAAERRINKGLIALKGFGAGTGDRMYALASGLDTSSFMKVILENKNRKAVNKSQFQSLIHIDFFKAFGNQRELDFMLETAERFKLGEAASIKREKVDGTWLEPIVKQYSNGMTKAGKPAASYTILDMDAILYDCELYIRNLKLDDYDIFYKVHAYQDVMGSSGYVTGLDGDRSILYIKDTYPIKRKSDGKQIGHSVVTQSIGSGIESRFTVWNETFNEEPLQTGDLIRCLKWEQRGQYFTMKSYRKLYPGEHI